jgi:hypothetical protein
MISGWSTEEPALQGLAFFDGGLTRVALKTVADSIDKTSQRRATHRHEDVDSLH